MYGVCKRPDGECVQGASSPPVLYPHGGHVAEEEVRAAEAARLEMLMRLAEQVRPSPI